MSITRRIRNESRPYCSMATRATAMWLQDIWTDVLYVLPNGHPFSASRKRFPTEFSAYPSRSALDGSFFSPDAYPRVDIRLEDGEVHISGNELAYQAVDHLTEQPWGTDSQRLEAV